MIHAINFASDGSNGTRDMRERQQSQSDVLRKYGISSIINMSPGLLMGTPFWQAHSHILSEPKGAGYWLWKPFIILQALHTLSPGDFLLYLDADLSVARNPTEFVSQAERQGVAVTKSPFPNYRYTKRDTFIILGADEPQYQKCDQLWAGVIAFRNVPGVLVMVADWLMACANRQVLCDDASVLGDELEGFKAHRHDQSVLTIICMKYGIVPLDNTWADWFAHPAFP